MITYFFFLVCPNPNINSAMVVVVVVAAAALENARDGVWGTFL
jgi:hypothetical protein